VRQKISAAAEPNAAKIAQKSPKNKGLLRSDVGQAVR